MTRLVHIAIPLLAALPLALLALWSYYPAQPYTYLSAEQLLTETYIGPARALSRGGFELRLALLVLLGGALCLLLARGAVSRGARVLAGTSASLLLVVPAWVPWVLSKTLDLGQWLILALVLTLIIALQIAVRRLPATAWPVVALCLLIGSLLTVRTAVRVTLISNPPLRVLHDVGREPHSPRANLAMGYHLLSLGSEEQAGAYFDVAGRLLLQEIDREADPRLFEAARELTNLQKRPHRDQLPDPSADSLIDQEAPLQ